MKKIHRLNIQRQSLALINLSKSVQPLRERISFFTGDYKYKNRAKEVREMHGEGYRIEIIQSLVKSATPGKRAKIARDIRRNDVYARDSFKEKHHHRANTIYGNGFHVKKRILNHFGYLLNSDKKNDNNV